MTLSPTSSRGSSSSSTASLMQGVYTPTGWDTAWAAALALSGSGLAKIGVSGDSTCRGYFASVLNTKGWAGLVRASLQATYGDGGSGFISASADLGLSTVVSGGATIPAGYAAQMKVVKTGNWSTGNVNSGPGVGGTVATTANGETQTYTVDSATSIDIYHLTFVGGGDFTYNIDGAGPVTVNTNGASGTAVVSVTGLAPGAHTVVITVTSGGSGVHICGVRGRTAAGVLLDNYACQGAWATNGVGNATYGQAAAWSGGGSNQADLMIVSYGLNDDFNAVTAATLIQQYVAIMNTVKEGTNPASLLLLTNLAKASWSSNLLMQQYTGQMRALADYYGAAIVNTAALWNGSWQQARNASYWSTGAGASGGPGNDTVHPGDIGHALLANNVLIPVLKRLTPTALV